MPVALCLCLIAGELATRVPVNSCAWVRAENDGAGAGFLVDTDKKLLITCRHVVADRARVDVYFPWRRGGELVTEAEDYLANRVMLRRLGLLVAGRVIKKSDELDLALVELESIPAGTTAVRFAPRAPAAGEPLHAIGHRIDLATVFNVTTGPARAAGRLADGYFWRGKRLAVGASAIIGQLPIEEGDSGGPVFDSRGALVGMVSALRRGCPQASVVVAAREIRAVAALPIMPDARRSKPPETARKLNNATVWIHPNATEFNRTGVLIANDVVLTHADSLARGDRVGLALPIREGERWIAERSSYADALGLHLKGHWRSATVVSCDRERDLALLMLDTPVATMRPLELASSSPKPGTAIHSMNHPGGIEFAWMYATGSVRQHGRLRVAAGESARRVEVLVCQLPGQAGSPGGAVVDDRGHLTGVVLPKESAQQVGYAVAIEEIAGFLDEALHDRPARTIDGTRARIESLGSALVAGMALGIAHEAEECRKAGKLAQTDELARAALALDPACGLARLCRTEVLLINQRRDLAMAELDRAIEKGPFDRDVLQQRAELAVIELDWRKARGDLERILNVDPADAESRQWLANVYLELGDEAKAAAALADTIRADPKRLPDVARNLVAQADRLAKKFPNAPDIPAGWLTRALSATHHPEFKGVLEQSDKAKTDAERLALLRAGVKKVAEQER